MVLSNTELFAKSGFFNTVHMEREFGDDHSSGSSAISILYSELIFLRSIKEIDGLSSNENSI